MLSEIRINQVKNFILEHKSATVPELSRHFQVSEETVRRDLKVLHKEGIIKKIHGGAVIADKVSRTVSSAELQHVFLESKQKIAKQLLPMLNKGDCIFVDASSTAFVFLNYAKEMEITVATNGIEVMKALSPYPNIKLIGIGGELSQSGKCFVGRTAIQILHNYFFDYTIFSCKTLSMAEGIMDSRDEEAEIKKVAIERATHAILLADYSKLDRNSFAKICDFNDIDYLISDKPLSKEWMNFLKNSKVDTVEKKR